MDDLIYSVREIFCKYLSDKGCLFYKIPEYQRGYKWTAENIIQLLEDLKNFKKEDDDSFYCLQNITVIKAIQKQEGQTHCFMNVIDGQQRLTTLFILIAYIQRNFSEKIITSSNILNYSVRETSNTFLKEEILNGKLWKDDIKPELAQSKDQYYMMSVASAIHKWFQNNELTPEKILDDLVLMVNEVEQGQEETIFASLNGGKVDLDGADLLRAILITRAAKQKYPSIDTTISSREKVNEFRVKLGVELDEMGKWWSQKKVKDYFEQLMPNRISKNHSFKYRQYPIDLLYYAFYEAYRDKLQTVKENEDLDLRMFENGIDMNGKSGDDHLELYTEIKEFHLTLMDWYNHDEIYNLIGYLMYNYKSAKISFELLWKTWEASDSKDDFILKLKQLIKEQIALTFSDDKENNDETLSNLRNAILDTNFNWYDHSFTLKLLPLIDILPIEKTIKNKSRFVTSRIEPEYFRRIGEEDKEHVRSQTPKLNEKLTEEEKNNLIEDNKIGLNSIGNIVLLHEGVNRSYQNDPHNKKMDRIVSEFLIHNWYIRPHTFDVFTSKLNNLENNGEYSQNLYWSDDDILRTVNDIETRMAKYLNL